MPRGKAELITYLRNEPPTNLYRVDPPYKGHEYIVVSWSGSFLGACRVVVFPGNERGIAVRSVIESRMTAENRPIKWMLSWMGYGDPPTKKHHPTGRGPRMLN